MLRGLKTLTLSTLFACALDTETPNTNAMNPPDVNVSTPKVEDVRCDGVPDTGPATGWRNGYNDYVEALGSAYHRGNDLIASTDDVTHTITGKLTYGASDKDLQDEDVDLFACIDSRWQPLGTARTNSDGRFSLALTGDERLPAGMRDLYLSVAGDRSGAAFIGFVAPPGAPVIVSDVDGTLTESENAYPKALAIGGDVPTQPDAPAALMHAAVRGVSIIYVTARGDRFANDTRAWFAAKGFPRGPVKMPASIITLPGEDTIEFKTEALAAVEDFELLAGIGNRATDVSAYTNAGLPPERIFIKLSEFEEELRSHLDAGDATGFAAYELLRTEHMREMFPD